MQEKFKRAERLYNKQKHKREKMLKFKKIGKRKDTLINSKVKSYDQTRG